MSILICQLILFRSYGAHDSNQTDQLQSYRPYGTYPPYLSRLTPSPFTSYLLPLTSHPLTSHVLPLTIFAFVLLPFALTLRSSHVLHYLLLLYFISHILSLIL